MTTLLKQAAVDAEDLAFSGTDFAELFTVQKLTSTADGLMTSTKAWTDHVVGWRGVLYQMTATELEHGGRSETVIPHVLEASPTQTQLGDPMTDVVDYFMGSGARADLRLVRSISGRTRYFEIRNAGFDGAVVRCELVERELTWFDGE